MHYRVFRKRAAGPTIALTMLSLAIPACARAQVGLAPNASVANPRAEAPLDLTGYWVSVVTEDWRYRMMTPDKGDFPGIFLTPEGRRLADAWDPAKDEASGNQCKSYGAGAIMRVPTRLHITWENDATLRIEADAGTQTRVFHFAGTPAGPPTLQGYSVASWEGLKPRGFVLPVVAGSRTSLAKPPEEGYLKVETSDLLPGYVRKNGVPYSSKATVEEYFDSFKEANGDTWLVVTAIVTDPQYLAQSYITSSQFKKLPDASGWNPTPCKAK
ncbi:MAG TPA: hypothetical protein VJO53_06850 [Candidatus Acidoferrales bacterium]|nr:hypothetical protein [Candidatus Acidoferrales bacterium]